MTTEAVLVGVDGSPNSYVALDVGIAEAHARGRALRLVAAYAVPAVFPGAGAAEFEVAMRDATSAVLDEAAGYAAAQGAEVDTTLIRGDAAGVLVEQSGTAGLVVVGARGRGGFVGRLLGSVASALPAHSRCPVIVVPNIEDHRVATELRGIGRIVVGVDESGADNPAVVEAASMAQHHRLPLTVLAAASVQFGGYRIAPTPAEQSEIHARIRPGLDQCVAAVQRSHPEVQVDSRIVDGAPDAVLVDATVRATRLVVGSRGRGGLAGKLLGSTSQAVLDHAQGPVVVVPNAIGSEDAAD